MSRTKKGEKGAGYEFWKRRAVSMCSPGRSNKKLTHRLERRHAAEALQKAAGDTPLFHWPRS